MLSYDASSVTSEDWDARFYHRVMAPQQVALATQLCSYIPEDIEGVIIDGGCGSGLVDIALLERYPHATVCAVDLSASMLAIAECEIEARYPGRASYHRADLQSFRLPDTADCFFSNAAMHWVLDHRVMFKNIYDTLKPGGVLACQMAFCGPHNTPWYEQLHELLQSLPYRGHDADMVSPVERIDPRQELDALLEVGFEVTLLEPHTHIFTFGSTAEHRLFMEKVILRGPLRHIPVESLRKVLIEQAIAYSDNTVGPLKQCYESLRCIARKSPAH